MRVQGRKPMPIQFSVAGGGSVLLDRHPDQCPICHAKVCPIPRIGATGAFGYKAQLEVVYSCPNARCNEFFIAYFVKQHTQNIYDPVSARPIESAPLTFEEPIKQISSAFCSIYEEAHKAEQFGLTEICGVGYRKALEFLIKDYVIRTRPADKSAIETTFLGKCIEDYVTDPKTKEVAKRATWLGNDETHYQRRWIDKDLNDLKTLIRVALYWIEAEYLTEQARNSMPAPSKP
jgi:hypothetical protein